MSAPYLGDFTEDATVHFMWSSNDSNGASITRSTDGEVRVYKDNGVGQSTAGVTDTEDFDSLTGIHVCTIDTSADAFYAAGANYTVVLSAATIDTRTVNAVLAHFSVENRFMRGTDSASTHDAAAVWSVATRVLTAGTNLNDLSAAAVNAEVDTALNTAIPGGPAANSINQRVLAIDDLTQASGGGDLAAILTDTGTDGVKIATGGVIDGALAAAELLNIADACLDRRLDLGTDTGGDTTTTRTWRDALRVLRNRADIVAGVLTVYEEDDSTAAFTAAISTASGDPIAQVNPT